MAVYFYGCISLDGYLSGKDHDLTWLYNIESDVETEYEEFYTSIDITIMGRNTFNEVSKMSSFTKSYPTTTNYVFTNHNIDVEGVISVSGDIIEFVKNIESDKNIWIVGGGGILHSLLEKNLVDKLYIQIAPIILGEGIRLFLNSDIEKRFNLREVKKFGQFAELVYEKIN